MAELLSRGAELYAALQSDDVPALLRLLHPSFRGELTRGLPLGLGGVREGLDAMLAEGWGAVAEAFDLTPRAERLFDGGTVLIARGWYEGRARPSGRPLRAAFAHFWSFDGSRFTGVWQVTDSAAWAEALG